MWLFQRIQGCKLIFMYSAAWPLPWCPVLLSAWNHLHCIRGRSLEPHFPGSYSPCSSKLEPANEKRPVWFRRWIGKEAIIIQRQFREGCERMADWRPAGASGRLLWITVLGTGKETVAVSETSTECCQLGEILRNHLPSLYRQRSSAMADLFFTAPAFPMTGQSSTSLHSSPSYLIHLEVGGLEIGCGVSPSRHWDCSWPPQSHGMPSGGSDWFFNQPNVAVPPYRLVYFPWFQLSANNYHQIILSRKIPEMIHMF